MLSHTLHIRNYEPARCPRRRIFPEYHLNIGTPPNDPEMHCITTLIRGVDTPISKVARQGLLTGGQR